METILKCSNCNQALMLVKESRGTRKDGSPSTKMVDKLKCPNCGKHYRENNVLEEYKKLNRTK